MASVLDIAKKINKNWGDSVLVNSNFVKEPEKIPMGDLGFDYPVNGGLPEGQFIVFSGVEFSGKTTAACLAMAQYQKKYPDKVCVFVDGENALIVQGDFIEKMTGLNMHSDNFLRYDCSGKAAEEIFSDLLQLQEAENIGMICIDSGPSLISKSDLDADFEKDNGMRSSVAKSLGKFIKMMLMSLPKKGNILLIINQVRIDGKNFMGAPIYSEPCGYALNYYPSLKLRFGLRNYTLGDKTDLPASKGEGADGFRLKFSITKSRLGSVSRGGGFLTFRLATGLDAVHDMLEVAMKYGFIERPTTQSYILKNLDTDEPYVDEETGEILKFVGKQKLIDYINSHEDFKKEYFEMLTNYVSKSEKKVDLLDKKDLDEILNQEAAVNAGFENAPSDEDEDEDEDE